MRRSSPIFLNGHINTILNLCPRIGDEIRQARSKIRPRNHHQSGRALHERGRYIMICPFKKIGELLLFSLESEHIFDNQYSIAVMNTVYKKCTKCDDKPFILFGIMV